MMMLNSGHKKTALIGRFRVSLGAVASGYCILTLHTPEAVGESQAYGACNGATDQLGERSPAAKAVVAQGGSQVVAGSFLLGIACL